MVHPPKTGHNTSTEQSWTCTTREENMPKIQVVNGSASSHEAWEEQKGRMDKMLAKLKQDMQEVKSMDKNLTRQFIQLGGQIKELKTTEKQLLEQLQEQYDESDEEDEPEDAEDLPNTKL